MSISEHNETGVPCGMCKATGVRPSGDLACGWCDGTGTVMALGGWVPEEVGPLLRERMEWEAAHPRPGSLRKAERIIVRALAEGGFGRQYQVTQEDSFEIAVDGLFIRVSSEPPGTL